MRYACERGLDRESICLRSGLDLSLLEDPDARIEAAVFADVWHQISGELQDEAIGLNLGRSLQHFPFGHISAAVMLNSRDLLSAFQNLTRYHNLMSDIGRPSLMPDESGRVCFTVHPHLEVFFHDVQYAVFIFSMVVSLLRYLGHDKNLNPISVEFTGSGSISGLSRFFGTEMMYRRPVCRMRFRQQDLATRIQFANPDLLPFLEQAADNRLARLDQNDTWGGKVRHLLEASMAYERQTIDRVAEKLHLTTRTLQNYLKGENTGFRQIYMEFREQKAKQLLGEPSISMIEVAFLLGFSEQSAFNHAFKKWTGDTPITYRRNREKGS